MGERLPVLVLASGGLDSATCLGHYVHRGHSTTLLWIGYGQAAVVHERKQALALATHYDVDLQQVAIRCPSLRSSADRPSELRGRNLLLLATGLASFSHPKGLISLGVHAGTPYLDCGTPFLDAAKAVVDASTAGRVQADFPLADLRKAEVVALAKSLDVPIHLTYSCETGTMPPCGTCPSCLERKAVLS